MPNSGGKVVEEPIVFFGSGPVAAASLELLASSFTIEAVVTKPRPPHHRGEVPVLTVAERLGIPLVTAANKDELSAKVAAAHFQSRVAVLIDFGILVKQDVINAFPLGIVNSHFSLLPEWRGPDPITFAILSGQQRTGVSLMKLVEAMDEGPIIAVGVQELDARITAPELTEKLIHLSYGLLQSELPRYLHGSKLVEQTELSQPITDFPYPSRPSYSRKLTKEDGILDFTKPAVQLEREVRAYAEWPKSHTVIAGKDVVVTACHVADATAIPASGKTIFTVGKLLCIQTSDGVLVIDRLKPAGKSEMTAAAFLAGHSNML